MVHSIDKKNIFHVGGEVLSFKYKEKKTLGLLFDNNNHFNVFYPGQRPIVVGYISEMTRPPQHHNTTTTSSPFISGMPPPWVPSDTLAFWTSASCALGNKQCNDKGVSYYKYVSSSCKHAVVSIWPFLPLFI